MDSVIQLEEVCFCRKNRTILDGISWQVQRGEHWALLGANGSGKTTLLKILAGYEWPTFGRVVVQQQTFGATDIRKLRRTIGLVSSTLQQRLPAQDKAIEVVASGLDATLGLYRRPSPEEMQQARTALSRLRAESIAEQSYQTLSQGEQQKVMIARALVCRPTLLILDEPCSGLDPAARVRFLKDIEYMVSQPDAPSILFVTHHIEEIGPWISHVLLLKDGKVLAAGTQEETITSENMAAMLGCRCEAYFVPPRWHLLIEE
ncbi:MAG TPA: ABC transporter ATP-binding protein [Anaerohalosphaeraceae bacterium]|nr:ABC transporter ATP-binding protein [Anaerohalosphaeraceae bacterium]HOL88511.1 ABC transporter ATP-binding protein [Anaerohalosphaeraceae bacterium]HPP56435.1 ABC transporter ATP-binding protein [Anaerohalosphaeraceae bacterium]